MTDRELVDALRSTTSRSKRKLLDAAADRIESTIRARTTDEVKYYPARMNHPNLCRPLTNADRIRQMGDEELAEFIRSMVDGSYNYDFACYKYTNYVTHHSDPANKGIYLCKCDDCESEGIGLDVLMWLQQPAEVSEWHT